MATGWRYAPPEKSQSHIIARDNAAGGGGFFRRVNTHLDPGPDLRGRSAILTNYLFLFDLVNS